MTRVLVVEDEAIICADICRTLARLGYDVPVTADTSDDAVAAVEASAPDLVLMDIKLSGSVDGVETVTRIRRMSDVPVIYLTSHSDEATLARAKETGPHGYLIKPFNERDLRTSIEVALRKHELEQQLVRRERWFSTTLRSLGDAVIATDPSERITFMNPVAEKLTGFTLAAATGRPLREVFRLVDEAGARLDSPVTRALETGFAVSLPPRTSIVAKDGGERLVDDAATPIVDDKGVVLGGVVVFRDVTAQKLLEGRLEKSERLASLGTMAAGIAHEVNNPLTVVASNVGFVLDEMRDMLASLPEGPPASDLRRRLEPWVEALADATEGSERVRKVIAAMRRFAGPGATTSKREVLDLQAVIDPALRLASNALRHKAKVVVTYGTTPFVEVDEGQMVQVFLNLLANAADAITDGDALGNEVELRTYTDDAGRAVAEVRDTGRGIPKAELQRIFDPFFSTKGVGGGMGLGLSICHGFVEAIDGELTVESTPGEGSTFRVSLPPARSPAAHLESGGPDRPAARARVLVLDDEPSVALALTRALRGHHVVTENEPRAALARIAAGETFDVFLCDMMMPGMTGVDVYDAVLSTHPDLASRIVFITGGALSPRTSEFLEQVDNVVVTKPFTPATLRELVATRARERKS